MSKQKKVVLGIDIGGTNTKFGLVTQEGEIINRKKFNTTSFKTFEDLVETVYQEIHPLLGDFSLVGVGVGAPNGNHYLGTIDYAPNLQWKGKIEVEKLFSEKFKKPCKLSNDANAAALGEKMYGAAKGMNDFIMITLGTGVGSGIIANGELVCGYDGYAGELGHVVVKPKGRKHWATGKRGTLEAYASATGISITAKKMRAEHLDSMLNNYPEDEIEAKTVFECAQKGDETAIEVFRYTGQKLGEALANFVMFSSPEAILLFGGVVKAGDFLLKPIRKYMEKNLLPIHQNKIKLIFSELEEADAAIFGAAALAWKVID